MLLKMTDEFGIVSLAASWEVVFGTSDRVTNHIFLPEGEDQAIECHWDIFGFGRPSPERRNLIAILSKTEGDSLVTARSTWGLFEAIMHIVLGKVSYPPTALNAQFTFQDG